mmetsp:Transcript_150261/g.260294  ORF Transcript_150261/g.260294 Transcript_150261/m.260294 type:complete len:1030 (-) Transcript_150261:65-3154(-)
MATSIIVSTTAFGGYLFDWLLKVLMGAKTEIAFFLFALITQAILFGGHRVKLRRDTAGQKPKAEKKLNQDGNQGMPQNAYGPLAFSLSQAVKALSGNGCGADAIARRLTAELRSCSPQEVVGALTGLLDGGLPKPASVSLLAAVRSVLRERGLTPDVQLGSLVLRGYFDAKAMEPFADFLRELDEMKVSATSLNLLALKGALRTGDLEAAMSRFQAMRALWQGPDGCTPSSAPARLLEQLVQLAASHGALPKLLAQVAQPRLSSSVLEALLVEAVRRREAAVLEEGEKLAREQGLSLSAAAYESLLRGATLQAKALQLLTEACSRDVAEKAVLIAALESPAARQGGELAAAVLAEAKRAGVLSSEVAAALLQLQVTRADAGKDADSAVLAMYAAHFAGLDLSTSAGERIVAEAALGCARPDVLKQLFSVSTETAPRLAVIKSLGAQKRLADAQAVFQASPGKPASLHNALLEACIQSGDTEAAQQVMADATQAGVVDVVSYNTQIKVHLRRGNIQEARKLIEMMRTSGMQPNVVTFNEILDATVTSKPEAAWEIVKEMKQSSLKPNLVTCSILLKGVQAKSRTADLDRVLAVVDSVDEPMDEVLLSSVIEACVRVGHPTLLKKFLRKQRTAKRVSVTCAHTFGSIIRACGVVEDVAGAWHTWREMREQQVKVTSVTLGCMVETLAMNGQSEAAYNVIQEMSKDEQTCDLVNSIVYGSVLKGFAHQRSFDRVWAVYDEMVKRKVQFSLVTFNTLIDACARSRDMTRIPVLLQEIDRQGLKISIVTYSAIIKGYCQANRLEESFKVLDDMRRTTELKPDEIMYNTLLDGCARQGLYDRGMGLLQKMQEEGVRPTNFTLSVLVKMACRSRSNQIQRAFDICDELSKKYRFKLNIHVYSNLVQTCTVHRDLPRALSTLERLLADKVRPDVRTYSLLMNACVETGAVQDAAGLLRGAVGLRSPHPIFSKFAAHAYQPQGGLPSSLISEVLEGLVGPVCRNEPLAMALFRDIQRLPGFELDPRLQWRLTARAFTS